MASRGLRQALSMIGSDCRITCIRLVDFPIVFSFHVSNHEIAGTWEGQNAEGERTLVKTLKPS